MLWISLYVLCIIIVGIFLYLAESSSFHYNPSNRIKTPEIVTLLIISPVLITIVLLKILVESVRYIFQKIRYFSRFWVKQTIGIMFSDLRWISAVNGKLQPEKMSIVHKDSNGKMFYAGDVVYYSDPNDTVVDHPISGGVVCHYNEMKFMVKFFLNITIPFFSFKTRYNIAIPGVTTQIEINGLLDCFRHKRVKTVLIPEVVSSILGESNFGLIYLAHSFTEITIMEKNSVKAFTFRNIGLEDLSKSIIKGASPTQMTGLQTRRIALESLMNEHDFILHGPDTNTSLPLEVTLTMSDFQKYSTEWISSIRNLFTKLPTSNSKWYVISDYGQLNFIASLISEECSVKIHPINDSPELIAKELSKYKESRLQ